MILIITHKADFTADFVINKLNERNILYKRLNCEDIFKNDYSVELGTKFCYSLLNESKFDAVWFRRTRLPELSHLSNDVRQYILNEFESFLENLFSILNARWISIPFSVYRAENKLLQLAIAKEIGFKIPETLVTNSRHKLQSFFLEHNENVIIKPISQTRIIQGNEQGFIFTNLIPQEMISNLDKYDLTPCIYQKNIEKDYEVRVTVVGESIFAASVNSQEDSVTKIDWRKKKLKFSEIRLPSEIESLCRSLLKRLEINFGAIDLIKTPNDEYVFLEINPNGQWAWIEMQTGQLISDSIIDYLLKG